MATPSEKLADSLEALQILQENGAVAIRSKNLSRTHRERLSKNGFLQEIIKGWYIPTRPDDDTGESTAWYASYWQFCASYLQSRFGDEWSLSPEQSLSIHTENWTVPKQLLVRARRPSNNITNLPYDTSLLDVRASLPNEKDAATKDGLRLFSLSQALIGCAPDYFNKNSTDARSALALISDASEVLERLLEGGHTVIAGRLAGAFRNIGRERIANEIVKTMKSAGYDVRETDPFATASPVMFTNRERSPTVNRIQLMWQAMREAVLEVFPVAPGLPKASAAYLKHVEDLYVSDAYHSLSIEGYQVSRALIEKVRSGQWNPDNDQDDREHRNALAARGYWQAFQEVEASIKKVLNRGNAGRIVNHDHSDWYRQLFAPGITAGILRPADLAGYRNGPVFIRRSMHVPPNPQAVRDAMPALFDLLTDESEASVRVVLGHFIFVYIHPYVDGNGRMGRFLMNTMLSSGGYPWTVVPVEKRDEYMAALESASVEQDIRPFARLLGGLVTAELDKQGN